MLVSKRIDILKYTMYFHQKDFTDWYAPNVSSTVYMLHTVLKATFGAEEEGPLSLITIFAPNQSVSMVKVVTRFLPLPQE